MCSCDLTLSWSETVTLAVVVDACFHGNSFQATVGK